MKILKLLIVTLFGGFCISLGMGTGQWLSTFARDHAWLPVVPLLAQFISASVLGALQFNSEGLLTATIIGIVLGIALMKRDGKLRWRSAIMLVLLCFCMGVLLGIESQLLGSSPPYI